MENAKVVFDEDGWFDLILLRPVVMKRQCILKFEQKDIDPIPKTGMQWDFVQIRKIN